MKKKIMSLAVAASVAGVAASTQAAMYLNPEGTGQVLLYPYYNAIGTNETSIHIVNTTADAKAVKVRILEYIDSREVLDFNLYLSPYDHFSFTIFKHPEGDNGALVTNDNSCTVPRLGTATGLGGTLEGFIREDGARVQPFLPYAYQAGYDGLNFDARSLVGHVEVIEMGTLFDATNTTHIDAAKRLFQPATWATHDSEGVPANCDALVAAWDPQTGAWEGKTTWSDGTGEGPSMYVTASSGGLYGLSNVLDSMDAAGFGIEPAAIADFWLASSDVGNHTDPGNTKPSLGQGDVNALVANGGAYYNLTMADGWDAVSALFMQDYLYNDVMINTGLNGMTDWVVTFPTKREYVDADRTAAKPPFTELYANGTSTKPLTYAYANLACEDITVKQWNREESTPVGKDPVFSPQPPGATAAAAELCLETNTIAIGGSTVESVFGTVMQETKKEYLPGKRLSFIAGETEGWMRMGFQATGHYLRTVSSTPFTAPANDTTGADGNKTTIDGLPAIGFAAFKYANGDRAFGFVSDHKGNIAGSAVGG
jgi:hypothetical protein